MRLQLGFTLIELLVVIGVIGILASFLYVNFSDANEKGRDTKRQSDLRSLQSAIELYKQRYGYYPAGCQGAGEWSGGTYGCPSGNNYIVGLAPEFIARLPVDPKLGTGTGALANRGYVYVSNRNTTTNTGGDVYKIMAMNTVESEIVDYLHPLKSCDLIPTMTGSFQANSVNGIDDYGWCSFVYSVTPYTNPGDEVEWCKKVLDGGNGVLESSYGVWGGFAEKFSGNPNNRAAKERNTTSIICRQP